jgi:hypothetical protein
VLLGGVGNDYATSGLRLGGGEATREPIAFGMVRPSLANGLAVTHPNLTTNDVICRKHLTEQRTRYVEQLLERERAELQNLSAR